MDSLHSVLVHAGLEPSAAAIYTYLAQNGEQGAPAIMAATSLSRAGAYDALNLLVAQGYVEYRKTGRNAYYKAAHPTKLLALTEERQREADLLGQEMAGVVTQLTAAFNVNNAKPGVQFFEGEKGLRQALWDSLNTKSTIYTIANATFTAPAAEAINREYSAERTRRKIKKRIIELGSGSTSQPPTEVTETKRLLNTKISDDLAVEVYDDTISYLNISGETMTAFLIKNPAIAAYHKIMFETLWQQAQY